MLFTILSSLRRVTARERLAVHIAIVISDVGEFVHIVKMILHSAQVHSDVTESRKIIKLGELKHGTMIGLL